MSLPLIVLGAGIGCITWAVKQLNKKEIPESAESETPISEKFPKNELTGTEIAPIVQSVEANIMPTEESGNDD